MLLYFAGKGKDYVAGKGEYGIFAAASTVEPNKGLVKELV